MSIKENGPVLMTAGATVCVLVIAVVGKMYYPHKEEPASVLVKSDKITLPSTFGEEFASLDGMPFAGMVLSWELRPTDNPTAVKTIIVPTSSAKEKTPPVIKEETPPKPSRHKDVCEEDGGHRVEYTRHHHTYWRCRYGRRR